MADMQVQIQEVVVVTERSRVHVIRKDGDTDHWEVFASIGSVLVAGYDDALRVAQRLCGELDSLFDLDQVARLARDELKLKLRDFETVGVS